MAALSRPPPRGSGSDPPPPVLPPRPGARTLRPPPATPPAPPAQTNDSDPEDDVDPTTGGPDEIYDDCNEETPGDVYDDCDENKPPAAPEQVYDDCDEQPPLPARPPARPPPSLPPALPPQETYDDLDNVGPIVQQLPKKSNRLLPPTPPPSAKQVEVVEEVYEATEDFQVPPQPVNETVESFYELGNDEETLLPPPPLPPHKDDKRGDPRLHSQPARAAPGPKSPGGGFAIDLNQLQGLKAGLRKVSVGSASEANNNDPKTYGECVQSVSEAKKKFQEKAEAVKPVIQSPKPAFLPKKPERVSTSTTDATSTSNTNAVKPNSLSSGSKPAPAVQQVSPLAPDVTFLPKASKDKDKDKHTNMPLPPVPSPQPTAKPVPRFEPKEEEVLPPDDIYDDACSGDLLDRFDWYHGAIGRQKGESRVKAVGKDGTFLVRLSDKDPVKFPYTLVVMHNNHVNNLRIRKRADCKFALGDEKSDELAFDAVVSMINHHKSHNVVLLGNNQSQVKLQQTPPKG